MKKLSFVALFASAGFLLAGNAMPATGSPTALRPNAISHELSRVTTQELAQARAATAKYHDISQAIADGYVDIDVFRPGQGFHYLNPGLLDGDFEPGKPELLVYAANPQGNNLRLVAVEYAVPVNLSAAAPQGFAGDADLWHRDEEFDLWTLHAWVWLKNPNGVFAEFSPRVP